MPNHVTNKLVIRGPLKRVEALVKQGKVTIHYPETEEFPGHVSPAKTEEAEFSLRGFIPPPNHPDYTAGSCGHSHPPRELPAEMLRAMGIDPSKMAREEHPNCWYVWNRANWGTKWDCYDVRIEQDKDSVLDSMARLDGELHGGVVVYFDTAWSPPTPVLKKIVELYSDLDIEFTYMDEDMFGGGGGRQVYEKGKLIEERHGINDEKDPEFVRIATDLKGYNPKDYEESDEDE